MVVCLIVDDILINRETARAHMIGLGFEVHTCKNGKEALDFCAQIHPQLILLDWYMPVMCGHGFLKSIKSKYDDNIKPFILLCSATTDQKDIDIAFEEGADDSIEKPFEIEIMKEKLQKAGLLE